MQQERKKKRERKSEREVLGEKAVPSGSCFHAHCLSMTLLVIRFILTVNLLYHIERKELMDDV